MLNPLKFISKFIKSGNQKELDRLNKIVEKINLLEENFKKLEDSQFPEKTKEFKKLIEKLETDSALIVNDKFDENLFLSSRNVKNTEYSDVSSINPVSLMKFEKVIMNVESLKIIEERLA